MSIVLRGITWEHERGHGSVVAAAEAYRAVAPDVEIRWEARSLQRFADQPLERLAETYDLLVIDHPHIPHAAEEGLLARLDGVGHDAELDDLARHSVGASHESYRHAGGQYGLATDVAAQVAVYRPDLLPEPPRDWPSVLRLAERGRVLWPHKPVDAFASLVTISAGAGEEPMRRRGRFLSPDALASALETMRRLAALVPEDNATWNPIQTADALSRSDRHVYAPLLYGYSNYGRAGFREHRLAYVDIPRGAGADAVSGSMLGGAGIAVSASSRYRDAAIAHAFWLASAPVQAGAYYDGGGQPGHALAWESDRLNADSLDFFRGTRATLEGSYLRPRGRRYIELQNALSPLVTEAVTGRLPEEELRRRLDEGVEEWLADVAMEGES